MREAATVRPKGSETAKDKAVAAQSVRPEARRAALGAQARLVVGPAGDAYEREADLIAHRVVEALSQRSSAPDDGGQASEPTVTRRSLVTATRIRRRSDIGAAGGEVDQETERAIAAERSGGRPLGGKIRGQMEQAIGADFGGVRVHEGETSNDLNRQIQAAAFTIGSDIFMRDRLDESSRDGQEMLAHELVHVVQQGAASQRADRLHRISPVVRQPGAAPGTSPAGPAVRAKPEALKGQSGPDQPLLPEPAVVDIDEVLDEEDLEDETEELEDENEPVETAPELKSVSSVSASDLAGLHAVVRTSTSRSGGERSLHEATVTGNPRENRNAAGSTCTPDGLAIGDLTWSVVDLKKKGWGVKVTGLNTSGQIDIEPTPDLPTTMTTPNTANPVDGGNIENNPGSDNHWEFAIKEMKEYHTKGGGKGQWHDTQASSSHEWAHWDTDWMKSSLGRTWPTYRRKMQRLRASKKTCASAAEARTELAPKVEEKVKALRKAAVKIWNKIPDEPGAMFATGYKAGQKVLDRRIAAVEKYATKKGWNLLGKIKKAIGLGEQP